MKKLILAFVLLLQTVALAEQCYFQTRRISYDSVTKVKKISCQTLKNAQQDVYFYNGNDNYARYFGSQFGKEGNLIVEIDGKILITKFYYAWGEFRYYGQIIYSGANVMSCKTTTSTGYCDQVEYNDFAMYLRDFLSSSVRKKKHNEYSCPKGQYAVNEIECEKLPKNAIRLPETGFECKTGFELYEDDDVAYCYKPYQCPKGQYAVDETECERLPKNAIRMPQEGFVCKEGYELYTNDDTTYCYKPYQCPKGHYAVSRNECSLLPKNAKRFAEEGYECLKGYVKIGEDCVKKASCKKNEFYQESDNECYGLNMLHLKMIMYVMKGMPMSFLLESAEKK